MAASVGLHVLLLALVYAADLGQPPAAQATARPQKAPARALPTPSCEADTLLATAARLVYCAMPHNDADQCSRAALDVMSVGLVTCNAVAMSTEVEVVTPEQVKAIEAEMLLALVTPEQLEELERRLEPPPERPPARRAQVVEITRPRDETPPENARYLSEFDSRTERETVARGSTEEMVERPQPRELAPTPRPRDPAVAKHPDTPARPSERPDAPEGSGMLAMRKPGSDKPAELARAEMSPGVATGTRPATGAGIDQARGTGDRREHAGQPREAGEGGGGGRPLVPNLMPSHDMLERTVGGGSVDHVEGVAQGETTALNSARWKYATFFNRMKREVAQHWRPGDVYARRDPAGNVYGPKDRITSLQVSLDPRGAIVRMHVVKSSGVTDLDEEAMRAFRAAHPFPNPPQGLVDEATGLITFTFGFHVTAGQPGAWKVFRQR